MRRTHPVLCFIAFAAFMLNVVTVSSGAILCQESTGSGVVSIEFACDHDHCEPAVVKDHGHDASSYNEDSCDCVSCPCEDSPLIIDLMRPHMQSQFVQSSEHTPVVFLCLLPFDCSIGLSTNHIPVYRPPPRLDRSDQLQLTVVLII